MKALFQFMASAAGRIMRIIAGIALIVWGILGLTGTTGIIVAIVGGLPLITGLFNLCLFAPLLGFPLLGAKLKESN